MYASKNKKSIQKLLIQHPRLPFPVQMSQLSRRIFWYADSDVMKSKFDDMYNAVVHWRKSLFLLPSGYTGKRFIEEMTRLVNSWTFRSEQETITVTALMVLPTLQHQKTSYIKIERHRRNFKKKT